MMKINLAIILFCKVPATGFVKTRLVSEKFSEEDAKNLQIAMIIDTLIVMNSSSFNFQPVISYYPENQLNLMKSLLNEYKSQFSLDFFNDIIFIPQTSDNLGGRFHESFIRTFEIEEITKAIIIGADAPHIDRNTIENANEILQDKNKTVIGPSQNGGFYLFGIHKLNVNLNKIFDKPNEFSNLIEISYNNKLTPELLPFLSDIDLTQDLYTLYSMLKPIEISNELFESKKSQIPKFTFKFLKIYFGDENL